MSEDPSRNIEIKASSERNATRVGDAPGSVGSETAMGSVMGTPAYMPPEQALGEIDRLDERADVFGLGAILCEILTGKPPYVGKDSVEVFRQTAKGNLDDCFERLEASGVEPELVAIARRALSADLENRWRHGGALSDKLSEYLNSVQQRLKQAELDKTKAQAHAEGGTPSPQVVLRDFGNTSCRIHRCGDRRTTV